MSGQRWRLLVQVRWTPIPGTASPHLNSRLLSRGGQMTGVPFPQPFQVDRTWRQGPPTASVQSPQSATWEPSPISDRRLAIVKACVASMSIYRRALSSTSPPLKNPLIVLLV